jgi:hypothetical protein
MPRPRKLANPFHYFNFWPEVNRLMTMSNDRFQSPFSYPAFLELCPLLEAARPGSNDRNRGALLPPASVGERPLSEVQKLLLFDRKVVESRH